MLCKKTDSGFRTKSAAGAGVAAMAAAVMLAMPAADAAAEVRSFTETDFGDRNPQDFSEIVFESLTTTYDTVTREFTWTSTFSPSTTPGVTAERSLPTGFVLVVNDGPMPKGHVGELATIYFDAKTDPSDPIISAYAYNGANSATSYRFGIDPYLPGGPGGEPVPDRIVSTLDPSSPDFVNSASLVDNPDGTRTLSMSLDASVIQAHTPLYNSFDYMADAALDWYGIGFAEQIGIWFHPFIVGSEYTAEGYLAPTIRGWNLSRTDFSFFDQDNLPTIPEPAAAAMLLSLGGLMLTRRRQH